MFQMSDTWSADVDSRYYVESVNATPFVYQEEVDYGLGCTFPFPVCVMCLIHSGRPVFRHADPRIACCHRSESY